MSSLHMVFTCILYDDHAVDRSRVAVAGLAIVILSPIVAPVQLHVYALCQVVGLFCVRLLSLIES